MAALLVPQVDGDCTFCPATGAATQVLALSSRADRLFETSEERFSRLSVEDAAVLRAKHAAKRAELEAELPFRPTLNPRSLRLAEERREAAGEGAPGGGHAGTAAGGARAGGQVGSTEELRLELEQRLQLECPFRPDTSKPRVMGYDEVYRPPQPEARLSIAAALREGPHALARRLEEHRAEREAAVEAARKEAEEKELAECTFAPRINAAPAPVARVCGAPCVCVQGC